MKQTKNMVGIKISSTPYPDGRIRKISFSIFLNNNFEGGEFDLEIHG